MHFELRRLRIVKALSKDSTCYTAEIWIDGRPAFAVGNRGTGGADFFKPIGSVSEADVSARLSARVQGFQVGQSLVEPTLESEVARLVQVAEQKRALRARLRTHIITIEDRAVYRYALRTRTAAEVITAIRRAQPSAVIVNEGEDPALIQAATILVAEALQDSHSDFARSE